MVVNFVNMNLNERPTLILKNAGGTPLCVLGFANNVALDLKYNEVSTLEFELPAYADGIEVPYYDDVVGMRIIEVAGVGQFTLVKPREIGDGVTRKKICEANSLEYEFVYKKISIPNGTYRFYYGVGGEETILGMILELMPSWSVGTISSTLYSKYRTFDETNENVYNFIKGAVQESFNCIFDFDTTNRRINVRDASETPASKPVYISTDNLAKEIEVTENTEDIVTRLDVNGAEGVDIREVNPTGTNKIIKLDYYMTTDNFSQSLIDKYYAWQSLCDSLRATYYNLSVKYSLAVMQKATEQAKLVDLQGELTNLENVLGVTIQAIAQGLQTQSDLNAANANIRAKKTEIAAKQTVISGIDSQINSIFSSIQSIRNQCSFENYFTSAERQAMDRYIKDDEVTESSFVAPTSTSYASDGNGASITSSSVSLTGATIEKITDTYSTIYDIRGGTLSVNGISAVVIGGVIEKKTANGFMATAYLHHGTYGGQSFQGGSISISGTYSSFTDNYGSGSLSATVTGYLYLTSDASEYEQRSISWELYDYGLEVISRLAVPTYSFSVTSANFLALEDFEAFKNHIALGEKVYIGLKEGQTIEPICIGVSFSYGDLSTLELSFSDSYASGDSEFRLVDLLNKSVSMGKNLSMSRYVYSAFVDTGASNSIREFMKSALDTAKNEILSSTNQAISWDGAGLRLRKFANEQQTAFENEQIWMNNNSIVMTDDAWATAKMAIGKFHDDYAGDVWGVVAPAIVGTVIAGENLRIESSKTDGGVSVFTVDSAGARLYNSEFEIAKTVSGVTTHVLLDPDSGIVIGKSTPGSSLYTLDEDNHKVINYNNANFYADASGNLHLKGTLHGVDGTFTGELSAATGSFSGTITAGDGVIGGWTIGTKRLSSGSSTSYVALDSGTSGNDYAFWAGAENPDNAPFRVKRNGNMVATNGSFTGTINATNSYFSGSVTAGSGSVGGWTISSSRLYAGSGTSFVCLDANTTDLLYAIWAGSASASAAPFSVKRDGTLHATKATIEGTVTAKAGTIGGWTLIHTTENGVTTKRLYSGTGTNYVALDAGSTSMDYVIWAGNATASSAPFSVKRDGTGKFNGTITAGAGSVIGGWYIGSDRIRSGNASGGGVTGMASLTGTNDIVFWAGNATPGSAPFRVTAGGALNATDATIKGTIKATSLYVGATGSSDGTLVKIDNDFLVSNSVTDVGGKIKTVAGIKVDNSGVVISSETTDTSSAVKTAAGITVNAATGVVISSSNEHASSSVSKISAITLSNGKVAISSTDVGQSTSNVYITPDKIKLATTGALEITSGNLTVDSSGNVSVSGSITATSGTIGGWTLLNSTESDVTTKRLYSGTGTNYVALDAGSTNMDYAIWAGNATVGSAPFRVKRDGTVYLTKLYTVKEDGTTQTVDLSSYPLWKLYYQTVKTHTDSSLTLSNGDVINFNTASSITAGWSGGALTAYVKNRSGTVVLQQEVASMSFSRTAANIKSILESSATHSCSLAMDDEYNEWTVMSINIDASGVYSNGWAAARAKVSPPGSGTGTSFEVKVPSATLGEDYTYTFTIQKGANPASSGYASVALSGTVVGRIAIGDWYTAGRNSVTVANSDIVRDGDDYYNSSTHNTTIYIEATASNGAQGTQSFTVSGASAYSAGQTNGASGVDFYSTGSWTNGSRTITLTNSKTTSVSIPTTGTWSSAKTADKQYSVTVIVGGRSLTSAIDTTGSYNAGYTAGAASVSYTLSKGSWSSRSRTVAMKNGDTTIDSVSFSIGLPATANSATFSSGTTCRLTTNINDNGSSIGSDWVQYDIETLLKNNASLSIGSWSGGSATVTAKINGTTIKTLSVTAPSTTQRSVSGLDKITLSSSDTGTNVTKTGITVYYDNDDEGTCSVSINAQAVYNAGWVAGYNAAVGKVSIGTGSNTFTVPATTSSQGSTPTTSYTISSDCGVSGSWRYDGSVNLHAWAYARLDGTNISGTYSYENDTLD